MPQAVAPALAALMKSDLDPVEHKLRCLRAISKADVSEKQRYLLATTVDVYVELNEAEKQRFAAEAAEDANKEVQKMVITWEDALAAREAKGAAEGEAKGAAEGEAKGEATGVRASIMRVLRRRLDNIPAAIQAKLDTIDRPERLVEILDQAIVANSIDELVLEP
jgi:flagellar biosynthesis/type III secretory pathway protein FliH